jgi:transcription factor MYB, plant
MGRVHPCCSEEKKVRKGLWSPEEDERLASHIARFGVSCWSSIPELAGIHTVLHACMASRLSFQFQLKLYFS